MAILVKLEAAKNTAHTVEATMEGLLEFLRLAYVLKQTVDVTMSKMNAIVTDPAANFSSLDTEIVSEGSAVLGSLQTCQQALNAHKDFIGWGR